MADVDVQLAPGLFVKPLGCTQMRVVALLGDSLGKGAQSERSICRDAVVEPGPASEVLRA